MLSTELDWRIRKTFLAAKTENAGKNLEFIDSIVLRKHYITITGNQSKTSFNDFLERCTSLNLIQGDRKKKKFKIMHEIWGALND